MRLRFKPLERSTALVPVPHSLAFSRRDLIETAACDLEEKDFTQSRPAFDDVGRPAVTQPHG
jgi:hypothetical protein